jgi:hypothetical protein
MMAQSEHHLCPRRSTQLDYDNRSRNGWRSQAYFRR